MSIQTTLRNADLGDLAALLKEQRDVKLDAVVPAQAITAQGGVLHVEGLGTIGDTVETIDQPGPGRFLPTAGMDGNIADSLKIPVKYLRRLREERIDLYDINVNAWLQGRLGDPDGLPEVGPDGRSFLFRAFRDPEGNDLGIGRALLSDTYKCIDNLDVLLGALKGVKEAGLSTEQCQLKSCDLSETKMTVRFVCPQVKIVAQSLLENYRNPFNDEGGRGLGRYRPIADSGGVEPVVYAGFKVTNGETGGSAFTIVPEVTVKVCMNGLTITTDMIRKIHLGGRNEEGIIDWSAQTERLNLELITSKTADAIKAFVSYDYLAKLVERIEEKASKRIEDPGKMVEIVSKQLLFTEQESADLLNLFIAGGQTTSGGVMQAVSAMAQVTTDPDRASEFEGMALQALELAFAAA